MTKEENPIGYANVITADDIDKYYEPIEDAMEQIAKQKKCVWCVHADLGDGVCKKCRNKSMWNVLWEIENDKRRSEEHSA